jgi:hypothetical protein
MPKIINLKSDEDVTSVVERLWETGASEVYFTVPKGAVLLRNIIGLKLLKREIDRLDKAVVLVTKDEVGREMAKRVGLTARVSLPGGIEEEKSSDRKPKFGRERETDVLQELPPREFESLIEQEVKLRRESNLHGRASDMSDIRIKPLSSKHKEVRKIEVKEINEEAPVEIKIEEETEIFSPKEFLSASSDNLDSYLVPTRELEEDLMDVGREREANKDDEQKPPRGLMAKKFTKTKKEKSSILYSFKFLSFFVALALLIAAAVLYFILPKAEIVIVPKTQAIVQDLTLTADKSATKVDATQAKIPGQLIKLDKKASKDFAATGQRQLNDKARGTITIYNEYSSSVQSLVQNTRFVSDSGRTFRLTKSITVPGANIVEGKIMASSIDADVVADQPGEEYNITPTNFKIPGFQGSPKYDAFYGQSKSAMSGGAVGQAKVVSQDDFDKAKISLWQDLRSSIDQELRAQVPNGLKILDGALKEDINSTESNAAVGSRADNFTLTIKGSGTVLLFDENDIYDLTAKKVDENLGNDKVLDEKLRQIEYTNIAPDFNKGLLVFKVKVTEKLIWKVDFNELKNLIAGKDETQIKQAFNERQEIDKARILFWPFWVKSVPKDLDKIKINLSSS